MTALTSPPKAHRIIGTPNRRVQRNATDIKSAGMSATRLPMTSRLFGPLASFLKSRVGCDWNRIVSELRDRSPSDTEAHRLMTEATAFVAIDVHFDDARLSFADGLLKGQPLRAGWRQTLYVCPRSRRLLRMPA